MDIPEIVISGKPISLDTARLPFNGRVRISVTDDIKAKVAAGESVIQRAIEREQTVYGVNTGFGKLADQRISLNDLEELQRRLLASHMVGVGGPLADAVVRATMVIKVICLAQGHSGVRQLTVDSLCQLINHDVLPVVPSQGSVGASGDLAPLAHMAAVLTGVGNVRVDGVQMPAVDGLRRCGLRPLTLAPKEGLALINGTQVSTALCLSGLFDAENVLNAAVKAGALTIEAVAGRPAAFDDRIQQVRRQVGQVCVADALRKLLQHSTILETYLEGRRVQDPYSIRCMPQVMGAAFDLLVFAGSILQREVNAVSDNPLVFPDDDVVLSGGNFHGQPVAHAADIIAMAMCEIGSLSERRTTVLLDPGMSRLPPFLTTDAGLNSGFQVAQVTAAALVAETRSRAFPASVDSIPTGGGQEDHVSMATHAARRLKEMGDNVAYIVAIELLAAAQGADLRGAQGLAEGTRHVYDRVRGISAYLSVDRALSNDIEGVAAFVRGGELDGHVQLRIQDHCRFEPDFTGPAPA